MRRRPVRTVDRSPGPGHGGLITALRLPGRGKDEGFREKAKTSAHHTRDSGEQQGDEPRADLDAQTARPARWLVRTAPYVPTPVRLRLRLRGSNAVSLSSPVPPPARRALSLSAPGAAMRSHPAASHHRLSPAPQ
jgi:hypothetical protein